jgi:exosortase A-associated hydrolase 1
MSAEDVREEVLHFSCDAGRLWGIVARPVAAAAAIGVVIVVGGPQYRVGSHRQFVLLARALASHGYPTLRFDHTGMGDSDGAARTFEHLGRDIQAAVEALKRASPQTRAFVVWGLCDAASAAFMHATDDPRIAGIVAANPWARSEASLAATHVRHYYGARLAQREFWSKLLSGAFDWRGSLRSLRGNVASALSDRWRRPTEPEDFRRAMANGFARFRGRVLLILSGNDLTAKEFLQVTASARSPRWSLDAPKVTRFDIDEADHTFSHRPWREAVEAKTIAWLDALAASPAVGSPVARA